MSSTHLLCSKKVSIHYSPAKFDLTNIALAQILTLCCGYVQRKQPMFVTMMAKSTYHANGMSNRIGAASPRARFRGIAVGTAISFPGGMGNRTG